MENKQFVPSQPIGDTDDEDSRFLDYDEANATGASPNYTCTYNKKSYSAGSTICWSGTTHECKSTGWVNIGTKC